MEKAFPNGPGLIHYPYLPMAFLPTVPVMAAFQAVTGWFDQRLIYLALQAGTLVVVGFLVRPAADKLLALMLVGLNPILANDLIYGYNDVFPLAFVALATLFLARRRHYPAALSLGVALATKLTAWPVAPFFLLAMWPPKRLPAAGLARYYGPRLLLLALPLLATALPYALADFRNFYDDVWLYNTGAAALDPVPIKGWGLANLVLLWGWVPSTTSPFPFWLPQLIVGLPLLLGLLWAQRRHNTAGAALLTSGVFLLVYFLLSRTMNANYLGFDLSLLAIGYFADAGGAQAGGP
jgi:Gpi18-like mannosyltransferase